MESDGKKDVRQLERDVVRRAIRHYDASVEHDAGRGDPLAERNAKRDLHESVRELKKAL